MLFWSEPCTQARSILCYLRCCNFTLEVIAELCNHSRPITPSPITRPSTSTDIIRPIMPSLPAWSSSLRPTELELDLANLIGISWSTGFCGSLIFEGVPYKLAKKLDLFGNLPVYTLIKALKHNTIPEMNYGYILDPQLHIVAPPVWFRLIHELCIILLFCRKAIRQLKPPATFGHRCYCTKLGLQPNHGDRISKRRCWWKMAVSTHC